MNRIILAFAVLLLASGLAFSQDAGSAPVAIQFGGGLYYNAEPAPTDGSGALDPLVNILAALFNIRGEAFGSLSYRFTDQLSAGGELALAYMTITDNTTGNSTSLFDIPFGAIATFSLDNMLGVSVLAGGMFRGVAAIDTLDASFYAYAGARAFIGGLYAEGTYVIPFDAASSAYPRLGVGYLLGM